MDITENLDGTRTETVYLRGLQLIAAVTDGDVIYYLHDGRGSVVQLVNTRGNVLQSYRYTAFGEEINPDENDTNPFRHNAEYFDTSSGLYYLRHRFYNPATGRFLNEDPIRWGKNWYCFAMQNPTMFIDPWGLSPDPNRPDDWGLTSIYDFVRGRGGRGELREQHGLRFARFELGDFVLDIAMGSAEGFGFNHPGIEAEFIGERWYANEWDLMIYFAFGVGPRDIDNRLANITEMDVSFLINASNWNIDVHLAVAMLISFGRDATNYTTVTEQGLVRFFRWNAGGAALVGASYSASRLNMTWLEVDARFQREQAQDMLNFFKPKLPPGAQEIKDLYDLIRSLQQ